MTLSQTGKQDSIRFVNALQQPAILFTSEGKVVALNRSAQVLFGIQKAVWQDDWFDAHVPCPREYQRSVPRYLAHYLEVNPDHWQHPVMASKVSGERFPLCYSLSKLPGDHQQSLCLCLLTNIEKPWLAARAVLAESEESQAISRTKTQFIHHVSQSLRQPVSSLLNSLTEVLEQPDLTAYVRDELQSAYQSGRDAQRTLREIHDFTRLESNKFDFQTVQFNLRRCLEDAVDSAASSSRRKSVEIVTLVSPYVPETVLGDPKRVQQVILNLLNNAVRFTSEGGITVKAWCDIESDTSATVEIEVTDTGCGMSAEQVTAIRKAFHAPGGNLADRFGGLGIGLAISKQIIDRMAGKMAVRSTQGVGTTFSLSLCFTKGESRGFEPRGLAGKRILLLNDNTEDRKRLEMACRDWGIKTASAGHGAQALGKLDAALKESAPYDGILIDLHRMTLAGINCARSLREHTRFEKLRIVLLADEHQVEHAQQADASGVDVYIQKPFGDETLFNALKASFAQDTGQDIAPLVTAHTIADVQEQRQSRALLVEDNEVNQIIAKGVLKKLGISADVTNNGEEAVAAVQDMHYDLILMDCDMPVMDGFEATRIIRAWEQQAQRHIPIIALTADESEQCRAACLAAGMDDFMCKPFRADQLHGILQKFSHLGQP